MITFVSKMQHRSFVGAARAGALECLGRERVAGSERSARNFAIGPRLLALLLITLLALPMDVALLPVQASPQRQEQPARTLAAKKKERKDKNVEAEFGTVRRTVTRTFSSAGGITIPNDGTATPYPSTINVAGFSNGRITDVNLVLNGFSHTFSDDVDILLVPAHLPGQNAIVLSDVGGGAAAVGLTLTLDDQAAASLSDGGPLASGTYQPTNAVGADGAVDPFPTQVPSGNRLLSVFNNANPNGAWQLFVQDNTAPDGGSISSWALQITAEVEKKVKNAKKDKKEKKDKKRRDRRD